MITTGVQDIAGAQETTSAEAIGAAVDGRGWVAGGLTAAGDLSALGATMRPIDELNAAGLGALTQQVQPLQDVLDRLAGNASVIQSFADTWQRVAQSVTAAGQRLGSAGPADTAGWRGDAADGYRARAAEVSNALQATATLSATMGTLATTMGQVVAGARKNAGDLLTDLVQRLISYVRQASAAEGGTTPNVLAQANNLINAYREPITGIEDKLRQTIGNVDAMLNSGGTGPAMSGGQAPVQLAMQIRPGQRGGMGDFPILEGGGGGGRFGGSTAGGPFRVPSFFRRLRELFQRKGPDKPIELPQTKPQQSQQPSKPWPKKEDYDNKTNFGRDKHNALAEQMRPFEGTKLKDGWEVSKVERTAGGTKRVDVMYINREQKRVVVEDYVTGNLESLEHANKGWGYKYEPEIQELRNQGYKFDYVPSYTEKLQ